jgi:hypothetical protein
MDTAWVSKVQGEIETFAKTHKVIVSSSERAISAAFEIGCLHALLKFYESNGFEPSAQNLTDAGEYRYLTTPSGNPLNFSFVLLKRKRQQYELRQQVRVQSERNKHIRFTPDIVVTRAAVSIAAKRDRRYASGRRRFYSVRSRDVVAVHECKSMNPFPELMVSFIGMLQLAHNWLDGEGDFEVTPRGNHLAPTLFIGGSMRPFHEPMIKALQRAYPLNIVTGMHEGTWNIGRGKNRLRLKRRRVAKIVDQGKLSE